MTSHIADTWTRSRPGWGRGLSGGGPYTRLPGYQQMAGGPTKYGDSICCYYPWWANFLPPPGRLCQWAPTLQNSCSLCVWAAMWGFGNPCNIHETIIYVSLWRTGIHLRGDVIMSSMQFFWNCLGVGDVSILSFSITASPALRVARVMESITGWRQGTSWTSRHFIMGQNRGPAIHTHTHGQFRAAN